MFLFATDEHGIENNSNALWSSIDGYELNKEICSTVRLVLTAVSIKIVVLAPNSTSDDDDVDPMQVEV